MFTNRDDYDSDTEESSSSSESESDSDEEEEEEDEEEETPTSTPVHHIRDIHPIKPSEEDQPELEVEEQISPDVTSPGLNKHGLPAKDRVGANCNINNMSGQSVWDTQG